MLRACVIDFGGNWDVHLPLVEFPYNNSYHSSIRCAPFEALYGRKCRSPVLWADIKESSLIGPELVKETIDKVILIKEKLKATRDHQNSYTDNRHKPLEFVVEEKVLLKVLPWKGVMRFGKKEKCLVDANLHVPLDEIKVDKTLYFVEKPVEFIDHEVKALKRSKIPIVKVHWSSKRGPEFTWEREEHMKASYAYSDSLFLTPLCCDDIHDVTPRVFALARCETGIKSLFSTFREYDGSNIVFGTCGKHLDRIYVTWARFKKKQGKNCVETASPRSHDGVTPQGDSITTNPDGVKICRLKNPKLISTGSFTTLSPGASRVGNQDAIDATIVGMLADPKEGSPPQAVLTGKKEMHKLCFCLLGVVLIFVAVICPVFLSVGRKSFRNRQLANNGVATNDTGCNSVCLFSIPLFQHADKPGLSAEVTRTSTENSMNVTEDEIFVATGCNSEHAWHSDQQADSSYIVG
nr:putative reverse transcriptase domain-containing protein [Tanacetum cinerariifolium]